VTREVLAAWPATCPLCHASSCKLFFSPAPGDRLRADRYLAGDHIKTICTSPAELYKSLRRCGIEPRRHFRSMA
jgi:hypothetical protein